ncbi:MAG: MnhB domain-containing protein [Clostridia bacterium]|nr:MnhB domain-containing protein [Clostridia bacterium]
MKRERPDVLIRLREELRAFLGGEQDALEERMTEGQVRPAAREAAAPDIEYRLMMENEALEAKRIAARLHEHNRREVSRAGRIVYCALCVMVCLMMITLLLYTMANLPAFGSADHPINNEVSARYIEKGLQETGAVNIVTGMILDYRAFDTLGESSVLFTAAMVVMLLLRMDADSQAYSPLARYVRRSQHADTFYEPHQDMIMQKTAKVLVPIVLLLGIYVVLNGHLSPGGGFSGGAIMGAALMIYVTAYGFDSIRRFFTYKTYQRIVLVALLTYAFSKCYSFYTGANGIHSVIPLGTPGAILSSGLILVLNICVGFIVTCTMYAFYAVFRKGEL